MPAKKAQFAAQSINLIKDLARKHNYEITISANKKDITLSTETHIAEGLQLISTTHVCTYEDGINTATTDIDLISYEESYSPSYEDDDILLDGAIYTFKTEDFRKFFFYLNELNDKYIDKAYSEFY